MERSSTQICTVAFQLLRIRRWASLGFQPNNETLCWAPFTVYALIHSKGSVEWERRGLTSTAKISFLLHCMCCRMLLAEPVCKGEGAASCLLYWIEAACAMTVPKNKLFILIL